MLNKEYWILCLEGCIEIRKLDATVFHDNKVKCLDVLKVLGVCASITTDLHHQTLYIGYGMNYGTCWPSRILQSRWLIYDSLPPRMRYSSFYAVCSRVMSHSMQCSHNNESFCLNVHTYAYTLLQIMWRIFSVALSHSDWISVKKCCKNTTPDAN